MKQVYYFYGYDVFGKKKNRMAMFSQEIVLWIEENINQYLLLDAGVGKKYSYGVKLFNVEDAMAFKLRWI